MTPMPVTLSPYRRFVCWMGLKAAKRGQLSPQRFCGRDAERYRIHSFRFSLMDAGDPYVTVEMWLCPVHAAKIKKAGYGVTKITLDNQPSK